jgi:hypothetical protein
MFLKSRFDRIVNLLPLARLGGVKEKLRLPSPFVTVTQQPVTLHTSVWSTLTKELSSLLRLFIFCELATKFLEGSILGAVPWPKLIPIDRHDVQSTLRMAFSLQLLIYY